MKKAGKKEILQRLINIFSKYENVSTLVKEEAEVLFGPDDDKCLLLQYVKKILEKEKETKISQIRKFFGHIRNLEVAWMDKPAKKGIDKSDLAELRKFMVFIRYAIGRGYLDPTLKDFFSALLQRVHTYEDFRYFVDIFEALVAYYVYLSSIKEEKKRRKPVRAR